MNICLFGAANDKIESCYKTEVERMCENLAKNGHDLVFGGGATGCMGAAARGFYKGGGEIFGYVPYFIADNDVEPVFEKCTKLIYTDSINVRKELMESNADVFLVVPGGIGTMEEFFEILVAKSLKQHSKRIILLNANDYYHEVLEFINNATSNVPVSGLIEIAKTGEEAVKLLCE